MNRFGFVRISVVTPACAVGNPRQNVAEINSLLGTMRSSDIVVFPELSITGYTCGDLFKQQNLLEAAEDAVREIRTAKDQIVFVGSPVPIGNELFNCAIAIQNKKILGIVPKQNIPNYNEFYESRWFRAADGNEPKTISYGGQEVPFGIDLLFDGGHGLVVHAEICEDLWMPIPPSSYAAIAGANILLNLSASNETVAKCEYRTDLVKNQSGRCVAAYAYASAGPTESTTDLVFGGHSLIAENSHLLAETVRVGIDGPLVRESQSATADVDIQKLQTERRGLTSFGDAARAINRQYRAASFDSIAKDAPHQTGLERKVNGTPFVPRDKATLDGRCAEVFGIQVAGLVQRLIWLSNANRTRFYEVAPSRLNVNPEKLPKTVIGVSGGLDSTLALLVAVEAYRQMGIDPALITGITMPGFGTTKRTKANAEKLMKLLGVTSKTIDIRRLCMDTFIAMRHDPFNIGWYHPSVEIDKMGVETFEDSLAHLSPEVLAKGDLVFENVQARLRTMTLMSHGFVLGTGDLSELALGWCTYNGDHMSMYNVNCSIPKTLVQFLVNYVAENRVGRIQGNPGGIPDPTNQLYHTLKDVVDTRISPELLPAGKDGEIVQSTEDHLGPYELHDFYLVNFLRNGYSPEKILYLSDHAEFTQPYSKELRVKTLRNFFQRFFTQQFKRSCVPDGPKVGSVSLSPRGDWRMPSDPDGSLWLAGVNAAEKRSTKDD